MIDPRKHDAPDRMGCGTKLLIGAFAAGALTMVALVALAFIIPRAIDRAIEAYTDPTPTPMRAAALPPDQREALDRRVEEFKEALDQREFTRPLVLTEDELNAVLAEEVDPREGAMRLELVPGQVRAQVSVPIDFELPLGPWARDLRGRYLNGTATLDVALADGTLDYRLRDFDVKGRKLPGYALDALQEELERSGVLDDPELREYLGRVEELRIERGRIVLTARE